MPYKPCHIGRLVAGLLYLPVLGWAEDDYFSMSLEELTQVDVAGASFSLETLESAPASVTVFTQKEIEQLGVQYLHELTNLVPGFQSKRQGDGAYIYGYSARGRQVGSGTRSVKIVMNGQPMTSAYIESTSVTATLIPLWNVSQVEFVRGPGSAVHGSGAMMGSIHVETRKTQNTVRLSTGSWGRRGSEVNLHKDQMYFSAYTLTHEGDQYQLKDMDEAENIQDRDPLAESHFSFIGTFSDTRISINHHDLESKGFYYFGQVKPDLHFQQREYTSINLSHHLLSGAFHEVTISAFANIRSNSAASELTAPGALAPVSNPSSDAPLQVYLETRSQQYGLKLLSHWLNFESQLSVGAEYIYDEPVSAHGFTNYDLAQLADADFPVEYSSSDLFDTRIIQAEENHKWSLFSEYQKQWSDQWMSVASIRYDYSRRVDESSVSPRLALIYIPNEYHTFKWLYSEAFRTPGAIELGTQNNATLLGNPNLKPETIHTAEIVWMQQYDTFGMNTSIFFNEIHNGIEQVNMGSVRQFVNMPTKTNDGLEMEARWQWLDHWQLRMAYTKQFEMLDTAFRLSDEYASLTLYGSKGRWNMTMTSVYQGASELNYAGDLYPIAASWHHNLSLSYRHDSRLQSQLWVSNLADRQYESAEPGSTLDVGLPTQGRMAVYRVTLTF